MISVPLGTGDISFDMISTAVDDICSAYDGTDIISYLLRKYIIRLCRISYRSGDISLKTLQFRTCLFSMALSFASDRARSPHHTLHGTQDTSPSPVLHRVIQKFQCGFQRLQCVS